PRIPSFLVDAGLELAAPIVLGSTGLGIYGFRGLIGMQYVASKKAAKVEEDAEWWKYYKSKATPPFQEGIQASKFAAQDGFSLGAGISLATVPDAGRAFSSKLFFLLSLPEVFLLQGQGQILKQRIGLDTTQDPPFFAMIAISSKSIEAAFGANFNIPDSGAIAKIDALVEMGFFWGNSGAWYVNFGKDQPEDRRVRARLLTLFNAWYYLMLSSGGIRTGSGVSYELKKSIGPFRVELKVYMNVAGRISFKPLQIGGSIELGGQLGLSIFGIGFALSASASLSGEAPKPFVVTGRLEACVKVLWSKRCVKLELTWTIEPDLNDDPIDIVAADLQKIAQALNVLTLERFPIYTGNALPDPNSVALPIVPMDAFIDFEFRQGVKAPQGTRFFTFGGVGEYRTYVPPQKAKSTRVEHRLIVDSIELMSWSASTGWQPYDVFAAATPLQLAPFITTNLSQLPFGVWQIDHPNVFNKLRVLALTPFSYLRDGTPNLPAPEDLGVGVEDVFCAPEERTIECRDFALALQPNEIEVVVPVGVWRSMPDVLYSVTPNAGTVRRTANGLNGLCVDEKSTITLLFPAATARAELYLGTEGGAIEVRWFQHLPVPNPNGQATTYVWSVVRIDTIDASELGKPVLYDDLLTPILRVDIHGIRCGREDQRPGVNGPIVAGLEHFFDTLAKFGDLGRPLVTL
ncbi:MAG TPA: hypothetical protein VF253_11425, partial [Candidatus Limnocylindrales bacterium]